MKASSATIAPPPGKLFPVKDRSLHLYATGEGSPTVLLEAGGGSWSLDWHTVQERVASFTRVVSYDRAGFGWSDPGPKPRHAEALAGELAALLAAGQEGGPYVLVGASFGGHIVRIFAARHPQNTAGMILLDARHETIDSRMPAAWKRLERAGISTQRAMLFLSKVRLLNVIGKFGGKGALPPAAQKLPPHMLDTYLAVGFQPKYFEANLAEYEGIAQSDEQVSRAGSLGDLPLAVIRHGIPDLFASMPPADAGKAEAAWQELQEELAGLSNRSRLLVAEGSGHTIQLDQPELVANTIREMVLQTRNTGL